MSDEVRRAAGILRAGGLVAFPTETVYGLGADASNPAAVARLYALKGRPAQHPVIVHFATAERAFEWARDPYEAAIRLAAAFWPGPLTLVLKRSARAMDAVTGGQDTVGLRLPSHPVARALLAEFGDGVAAPSANRYGRISPTTAAHVREDFGAVLDAVLEGGASEVGIESTIVDCSRSRPVLLRPGHIGAAQLEAALGAPLAPRGDDAPRHSGGEARHYAPRTPAHLVESTELGAAIARWGDRAAVLAFAGADERTDYWLRMPREPEAYARRLYAALRELDSAGADCILIEAPPATGEWAAVRDRLARATTPDRG
jgi:L-threonylcarbamoyladenylate synthase